MLTATMGDGGAVERLRALDDHLPADPVEAAVDWLRWCVAQRVSVQGVACEAVVERAARAELDARAELLALIGAR